MSIDAYPEVTLKAARERQAEARATRARGDDLAVMKREAAAQARREAELTFEAATREWLGHQAGRWAADTLAAIRKSLDADVFPKTGARPMAHRRPHEVMETIKVIEARGVAVPGIGFDVACRVHLGLRLHRPNAGGVQPHGVACTYAYTHHSRP